MTRFLYVPVSFNTSLQVRGPRRLGPDLVLQSFPRRMYVQAMKRLIPEDAERLTRFVSSHFHLCFRVANPTLNMRRLPEELGEVVGPTDAFGPRIVLSSRIAQFLGSATLQRPLGFFMQHQFTVTTSKAGGRLYGSYGGQWSNPSVTWIRAKNEPLDEELLRMGRRRLIPFSQHFVDKNRLGVALRAFTRTLFIDEWELSFLTHWRVLEALASEAQETNHKIAERIALLCQDRLPLETFREVKRLASVRSRLVHASPVALPSGKAINDLSSLADIARSALRTVIDDQDILAVFQKKEEALVDWYMERLLG